MTLCCPLRSVCLLSLFSHGNKECLFGLFRHDVNEDLSLLFENFSPKLRCAPLRQGNEEDINEASGKTQGGRGRK